MATYSVSRPSGAGPDGEFEANKVEINPHGDLVLSTVDPGVPDVTVALIRSSQWLECVLTAE